MNAPSAQRTGFVKGTSVWTKSGIRNIEQVTAGDWVLSRPEDPNQGVETGYKRVTKTFSFENKEIIEFWWEKGGSDDPIINPDERLYVTPNHPVWLNPYGWVPMGRLHLPGKMRPGSIMRGEDEWLSKELVLASDETAAMLDITDLYCTDKRKIAFTEEDGWGLGAFLDFTLSEASPTVCDTDQYQEYDYEKWGDAENRTRERYTTTVYNIEVEDWHTYFVGKMGLWVKSA